MHICEHSNEANLNISCHTNESGRNEVGSSENSLLVVVIVVFLALMMQNAKAANGSYLMTKRSNRRMRHSKNEKLVETFFPAKFFLNKIYLFVYFFFCLFVCWRFLRGGQHKCRIALSLPSFVPKIVARSLLVVLLFCCSFFPSIEHSICLRRIILYTKYFRGLTSKAYKINIFHCIYWLNVKAFGIHFFCRCYCSSLRRYWSWARVSSCCCFLFAYNHSFVPFIQSSFILKFTFYIKLIINPKVICHIPFSSLQITTRIDARFSSLRESSKDIQFGNSQYKGESNWRSM